MTDEQNTLFSDLMTLLDRIEQVAGSENSGQSWEESTLGWRIKELCHERFKIAENHGLTLEILGPISGRVQ